jgi:hypothetical protein
MGYSNDEIGTKSVCWEVLQQFHDRLPSVIIIIIIIIIIYEETIDHLISGCPTLAKNEHIIKHDKVSTHLHYSI